ncbi:MAG TPA: hypothetical protein VF041_07035 [Gemmatimonadaceae bacterium]
MMRASPTLVTTSGNGEGPIAEIALGPVSVEIVGASEERGDDGDAGTGGEAGAEGEACAGWMRMGDAHWRREAAGVAVDAALCRAPDAERDAFAWSELHLAATALRPVAVRRVAVPLEIRTRRAPWVLDRAMRWRPLRGAVLVHGLTPLAMRWERADGRGAVELRTFRGAPCRCSRWSAGTLALEIILDAAALHPRWSFDCNPHASTAAPEWQAGRTVETRLHLRAIAGDAAAQPVVAGRFPAGHEAAFVITDHSDFDGVGRLAAFLDGSAGARGWLGRGLRLTKGVFALPSTPPPPRVPAPSLADSAYLRLVRRLHGDGSEIAPHGVNESGNVPPERFREGLARVAMEFAPRTWIDHGMTLRYAYTLGGAGAEYDLLGALRSHGITTLWSYHDAPSAAVGSLDQLAPRRRDTAVMALLLSRHLGRGAPLVAAHYLRSLARERLGGPAGQLVATALSLVRHSYMTHSHGYGGAHGAIAAAVLAAGSLGSARRRARELARQAPEPPYTRDEALAMGALVYPERAAPLADATPDDLLLFATMEVLHTRDAYTPAALDRLARERGAHIGHCYLLNRLPYIAGVFDASSPSDRLSRAWLAFLDALAERVAAGVVWNPPVGELAEWLRAAQGAAVVPVARGVVEVRNPAGEPLHGFTILFPRDARPAGVRWGDGAPAGTRPWGDWLAAWGTVPARGAVRVRWSGEP